MKQNTSNAVQIDLIAYRDAIYKAAPEGTRLLAAKILGVDKKSMEKYMEGQRTMTERGVEYLNAFVEATKQVADIVADTKKQVAEKVAAL